MEFIDMNHFSAPVSCFLCRQISFESSSQGMMWTSKKTLMSVHHLINTVLHRCECTNIMYPSARACFVQWPLSREMIARDVTAAEGFWEALKNSRLTSAALLITTTARSNRENKDISRVQPVPPSPHTHTNTHTVMLFKNSLGLLTHSVWVLQFRGCLIKNYKSNALWYIVFYLF